ncbi:FAD binding domain protein [Moelleriella libera RCEF 2490]|uniref:FAD binding domain protein n=1 Tax=Moelleriella libera RCEF 2490 TaxID=1081109 RepID=A0A167ZLB2_9HYPO|nr:FAD binding domain protein [Moelleriella libera RCEF 2490]
MYLIALLALVVAFVAEAIEGGGVDVAGQKSCRNACHELSKRLGARLHYPYNDNYTFWDLKQQEAHPHCRAEPTSSGEVAFAVRVLVKERCRFAIKSGGHARELDDSNSVGGVTLDLQRMRSVQVSPDRSRVRLGSGHNLLSAYRALDPLGLSFVGGRVDSVGLGGFTLGGGYSRLTPMYGLAMDNVFEYEIVLANASTVRVNERNHPDLYFALRGGGGNNFGVVTHFTVRAVEQGLVWGGTRVYEDKHTDSILSHLYNLTTGSKNETKAAYWGTHVFDGETGRFSWAVSQEYSSAIEYPSVFTELNKVPHESSTLRLDNAGNFSIELARGSPWPRRNIFATITHKPSIEMEHRIVQNWRNGIRSGCFPEGISSNVVTQPLWEGAIRAMKKRGGNPVAIEADGPLTVVLLIVTWKDDTDDEAAYSFARKWVARAEADAFALDVYHPYKYINYVSKEQDPFAGYRKGSVERLRAIQRKVDPLGVFTSRGLCRGYFKLQ